MRTEREARCGLQGGPFELRCAETSLFMDLF